MKPLILAAAVAAFEFSFLASIASLPSATAALGQARATSEQALANGARTAAPCTPPG